MPDSTDPIKESFRRAKQDILDLQYQINLLKQEVKEIKRTHLPQENPTHSIQNPTNQQINPTNQQAEEASNPSKTMFSTGNRGVPTNKQTDKQTDQHIHESSFKQVSESSNSLQIYSDKQNNPPIDRISKIEHVSELLDSLDSIKKDLRVKFKRLTSQEMAIFSAIYQLEEEHFTVDYSKIAQKLSLSESSVREYVLKIIKKGIPISKIKQNNKKVFLSIVPELKKMASLDTILKLREI